METNAYIIIGIVFWPLPFFFHEIGADLKTQERLEKQFDDSLSILEPLKARIKATDELIDEIVYRLYGINKRGN